MAVLQSHVDFAFSIARPRDNKPYGYGGVWAADNVWKTTDCSGIVTHVLDALVNGNRMTWSRLNLCTESYRYVGGPGSKGPFATIRVGRPSNIPDDAALRIGLMHGPGGGTNSHMACTLEGVAIESSGTNGQQIGPPARGYDDPLFHDWFYLPGPIISDGETSPESPYPPGLVFLRIGSTGPRVRALQERLNRDYPLYSNLEVDGNFGPQTEAVVKEFQRRSGLVVDGVAGPATLTMLGLLTSFTATRAAGERAAKLIGIELPAKKAPVKKAPAKKSVTKTPAKKAVKKSVTKAVAKKSKKSSRR